MITKKIDIKTADGLCDAYISYPNDDGQYPGTILYMDAFGIRPWLLQMSEKLASQGYFVLTPNVFYRQKRTPISSAKFPLKKEDTVEVFKEIRPLIDAMTPEMPVKDGDTFLKFLSEQKQVKGNKFGLTGYCMGGVISLRVAAQYPEKIAAVACFHGGRLATDADSSPHKLLPHIKAEIYFGHADNDQSLPADQIERLQKAIDGSKVKGKAEVYEGASHGYTMADLPAYNKEALEKHWQNLFALFDRNLKN